MAGTGLTPEEEREVFGAELDPEHAREARERWGDTDAWRQSQQRTARYTKQDWIAIRAEAEAIEAELAAALRAGEPAAGTRAMDAAEAHRRHVHTRFYDTPYAMHRCLADSYTADERFTRHYDDREPGLAQYVHDAIHANADRGE